MIRLLIADDHPIVREGLKRVVAECPDIRVVAEAVDADEVVAQLKRHDIDIVLLDISMPGPTFLSTMRRLRTERPDLPVLVLSVHPEEHYAVRALKLGAAGYLTKDRSPEELAEAIRRVNSGRKYVTPSLAERLAHELGPDAERVPHEALSGREYEVLRMLAAGKSIKEIASNMTLSPKTVSTYRTRILVKMKLDSNADLIRYALEKQLV